MPYPVSDGTLMSALAHQDTTIAIRRLCWKRRRVVQQRKRRGRIAAAAAALALSLSTAIAVGGFTGADLADAAATRARNLMEMMNQRSPGARTAAQLTKTKSLHQSLAERTPAPTLVHVPANLAQVIVPPVPGLVPVDLGPPLELTFLAPPSPPVLFAPPPGGGGGSGGGGSGGGGGPGSPGAPPPPPPPPPPAVPEPGTWMTMLLGFGMMGCLLRRERAAFAQRGAALRG